MLEHIKTQKFDVFILFCVSLFLQSLWKLRKKEGGGLGDCVRGGAAEEFKNCTREGPASLVCLRDFPGAWADFFACHISIISGSYIGSSLKEKRTTLIPVESRVLSPSSKSFQSLPSLPPHARVPLGDCLLISYVIGNNGSLGVIQGITKLKTINYWWGGGTG